MTDSSKDKEFASGYIMNFQFLSEFEIDWKLETVLVFNHLLFRGWKTNWVVSQSTADADRYLRIKRNKYENALKFLSKYGMIHCEQPANGDKLNIIIDVESIKSHPELIFNYKSEHYNECVKWLKTQLNKKPTKKVSL